MTRGRVSPRLAPRVSERRGHSGETAMPEVDAATLVARIHAAPIRLVLAITGGGSRAIAELLEVPGGSRTLLEAVVPYSSAALEDLARRRARTVFFRSNGPCDGDGCVFARLPIAHRRHHERAHLRCHRPRLHRQPGQRPAEAGAASRSCRMADRLRRRRGIPLSWRKGGAIASRKKRWRLGSC